MASQTTVGSFPALHLVPISLFGKVQASVEASLLQDMRRISNNSDACLNSWAQHQQTELSTISIQSHHITGKITGTIFFYADLTCSRPSHGSPVAMRIRMILRRVWDPLTCYRSPACLLHRSKPRFWNLLNWPSQRSDLQSVRTILLLWDPSFFQVSHRSLLADGALCHYQLYSNSITMQHSPHGFEHYSGGRFPFTSLLFALLLSLN